MRDDAQRRLRWSGGEMYQQRRRGGGGEKQQQQGGGGAKRQRQAAAGSGPPANRIWPPPSSMRKGKAGGRRGAGGGVGQQWLDGAGGGGQAGPKPDLVISIIGTGRRRLAEMELGEVSGSVGRRSRVGRRAAADADRWNRRMEGSFVVADLLVGQPRDMKISGVVSDLVDGKGSSRLAVPSSCPLEPLPFLDWSAPRF
uniref:Uncharacterized protein n=1 Tax=Oryza meridionalis TaxID=40149 RepID=A0A0E0E0F1_9ORYZ